MAKSCPCPAAPMSHDVACPLRSFDQQPTEYIAATTGDGNAHRVMAQYTAPYGLYVLLDDGSWWRSDLVQLH